MKRQILVTSALPYANGPIHLGHLVEYIQTDVFARFQRLRGHDVAYLCADDTHGAAIMIRAQKEGRRPDALVADMAVQHQRDFAAFGMSFDHYGSTNSPANLAACTGIWQRLRERGMVVERSVERLYDPVQKTFLADRFVVGTCPRCGAADQYGDSCEACGATYPATELKNPRSAHSGAAPELRPSTQLFVRLEPLQGFLTQWTQTSGALQPEVANYLAGHFLDKPLQDWDVSRPAPYFGFEIPDAKGQYWYVWFDAPVGYIAATMEWCERTGRSLDAWWRDPRCEIVHFLGKDITYFHTLFWPALLHVGGYQLPRRVQIHGFLRVNGEKMSKSKGTFVTAERYLQFLDPEWLRYYYASKLSSKIDDLDFQVDEFVGKVNSDLVGRVVNLASRSARFVEATGLSAAYPDDGGLFARAAAAADAIAAAYEACEYREAMRLVMTLADAANEYVERKAPWTIKKDPARAAELQDVCTVVLNLFRQIAVYLQPVLPGLAAKAGALLGSPCDAWDAVATPHRQRAGRPRRSCDRRARRSGRRCRRRRHHARQGAARRRDHHRRLPEGGPARRRGGRGRVGARGEEAAAPDAVARRRRDAQRLRRHQGRLRAGEARRPARRDGGQPRAAQDEVRHERGHGHRRRHRRRGPPAVAGQRREAGPAPALTGGRRRGDRR
jgi:methionyl-tRNA synthetase